jgi:hypothetical protein
MVVIGVLLGGVLKGQQLIENAKIKRVVQDVIQVKMAYQTYLERYRALPGDNAKAAVHHGIDRLTNGNGNGAIQGNFNATNGDESQLTWQHLRAADLYQGDDTGGDASLVLPTHPWGGVMGLAASNYGMRGMGVCLQNVAGEHAMLIDIQQDDGEANSGAIRAGTTVDTNTAASRYDLSNQYHVCFSM